MNNNLQKLNSRVTALAKTRAIPEDIKPKWKESLVLPLISSEESDNEDNEGSFNVRPLPWRSQKATEFFRAFH